MKLAIIANPVKYQVKDNFIAAMDWAEEKGVPVYVKKDLCDELSIKDCPISEQVDTDNDAIKEADYILVLGGDGTILHVARQAMEHRKPILGVNSGRLGFMANTQKEDLIHALDCLQRGDFELDKRNFLKATTDKGGVFYALNEFLFTRKDSTSMITVGARFNGDLINKYWADGLIVSSPTGSTAYNLSAGGPIVMPGTEVLMVTPINPHTLTTRPLVLPSTKKLTISVEEQSTYPLFSCDGNVYEIDELPFTVEIERSEFTIDLISLPGQNYFETLRNKLLWGIDKRRIL